MSTQKDLYPIAEAQFEAIDLMPESLLTQCKTGAMAIRHTALHSGFAQEELAEQIGKAREVLSRACNGRGGLDIDTMIKLMNVSGSAFILQYMAHKMGLRLIRETKQQKEIRELEEKLAHAKLVQQIQEAA
jgi:plasmid maintenance system antidote protein VapI